MTNTIQSILVVILVALAPALYGQDLDGQWNGILQAQGNTYHIVFHVNQKGNGYEATFDSPDQNVTGIAVTSVTHHAANVTLEIKSIGAVYAGLISEGRISGKWMQSGLSFPLILDKAGAPGEKKE